MKEKEIVEKLNEKYKGRFIFEVTDDGSDIVGFVDDETFNNVVAVIEPTISEMNKLITHIENSKT
jgi:hypothetical protein|tara:strand:- start:3650 stop:3844 length:195 start_codon:yes stop_codon:yes gene_type:complete